MRVNEADVLSVKQLTRYIKARLENDATLQDVWVRGEISNFTRHTSGHFYFTLKDEASRVKSIMFASHNQRLPFLPKEGTKVIARGNISVYERDGAYQFYVTYMQPDGIGSLYLAYEQLKKKLDEEGLFAEYRKRPIPRFPRAIGVITSPTGAAVRDIIITLQRRFPQVPVLLHPVLVQGTQAAPSIARAIRTMNERAEVDVLIVGRGGGSLEELWAFNEEAVARAIYHSAIPVISAVGHETDFTIADFVADLRAATPTAAAELAVPHAAELRLQVAQLAQRSRRSLAKLAQQQRERLARLVRSPALAQPRRLVQQPAQRLDRLREQLGYRMQALYVRGKERKLRLERSLSSFSPKEQLAAARQRTQTNRRQLVQAMQAALRASVGSLDARMRQLDALSPLKVMQRGYSLVYDDKRKKLVKSLGDVQLGDIVRVRVTDGVIGCHVWEMEENAGDEGKQGGGA